MDTNSASFLNQLYTVAISLGLFIFNFRFLMFFFKVNYYNPITQSIVKITNPFLFIFRIIPNIKNFEISTFLVLLILHFITFYISFGDGLNSTAQLPAIASFIIKKTFLGIFDLLIIIMIAYAISSWFRMGNISNKNHFFQIIDEICNPIIFFIRRFIPTSVGVIDFSVVIALFLILILQNIINVII